MILIALIFKPAANQLFCSLVHLWALQIRIKLLSSCTVNWLENWSALWSLQNDVRLTLRDVVKVLLLSLITKSKKNCFQLLMNDRESVPWQPEKGLKTFNPGFDLIKIYLVRFNVLIKSFKCYFVQFFIFYLHLKLFNFASRKIDHHRELISSPRSDICARKQKHFKNITARYHGTSSALYNSVMCLNRSLCIIAINKFEIIKIDSSFSLSYWTRAQNPFLCLKLTLTFKQNLIIRYRWLMIRFEIRPATLWTL